MELLRISAIECCCRFLRIFLLDGHADQQRSRYRHSRREISTPGCLWLRDERSLSGSGTCPFCPLVWVALAFVQSLVSRYGSARWHLFFLCRNHRQDNRYICFSLALPLNQKSPFETVTSNGNEGMPLATTNSWEAPNSRSVGISTFVVITAAPVATP